MMRRTVTAVGEGIEMAIVPNELTPAQKILVAIETIKLYARDAGANVQWERTPVFAEDKVTVLYCAERMTVLMALPENAIRSLVADLPEIVEAKSPS